MWNRKSEDFVPGKGFTILTYTSNIYLYYVYYSLLTIISPSNIGWPL